MSETFRTGIQFNGSLKRWAKIGSTKHFGVFCRLEWSEDFINEKDVMYLTEETVRVKLNKHGCYYRKPFGMFHKEEEMKIIVRAKAA